MKAKVPSRRKLLEHIETLQSQILMLRSRPVTLNTSYEKPKCHHGFEMEFYPPRACPSCVKKDTTAQDQLAAKEIEITGWKSANGDKDAEIVKLRAVIEYLEDRNGR